jgi:hypothetical protein
MANIRSIKTQWIATSPFIGLCEDDNIADFTPHYTCKIVCDDARNYVGTGDTVDAAEDAAKEAMEFSATVEVRNAVNRYNAAHGIGTL